MLGTQTWFKTVRCHSIWAWFGAKPRTFLKGSAQLPAQLFVPAHFRKVACGVFVWAVLISLGHGFFVFFFHCLLLMRNTNLCYFLPNLKRLLVSDQGQRGDSAWLKVSPISGNVTAAVLRKHFIQNNKNKAKNKPIWHVEASDQHLNHRSFHRQAHNLIRNKEKTF